MTTDRRQQRLDPGPRRIGQLTATPPHHSGIISDRPVLDPQHTPWSHHILDLKLTETVDTSRR
jgi:hypothetical protein